MKHQDDTVHNAAGCASDMPDKECVPAHTPCLLVALVGRPNVGKSSLFNRLAKKKKAIVDSTPGVTRDRHYERVVWDERAFVLIDTGGIESDQADFIAGRIKEQTLQAIQQADIIIFVLDGKGGLIGEDYEIADLLRRTDKPTYFLVNKIDGPELEQDILPQFYELGVETLWPVSASHGYGVKSFMTDMVKQLAVPDADTISGTAISFACIGRPNVGKSSLINRLLGEERMVVSDVPGTTRDSVDTLLEKNGRQYLLIDTAGIRRKGKVREKIEKFSVMRALAVLERCDLALIIIDAEEGITEQDTKIIGYALEQGRACLVLVNKWDLVKGDKKRQKMILEEVEMATRFVGFAPTLTISALTGYGVKHIYRTLDEVYRQYSLEFTTNRLNRLLRKAVDSHSPSLYRGKRLKLYYTTQIGTRPPAFVIFANYPKEIHFSYHRYLVNQFRAGLGLDKTPLKLLFRERKRKRYE